MKETNDRWHMLQVTQKTLDIMVIWWWSVAAIPLFFAPFSVVRPTQNFRVVKKSYVMRKVMT